MVHAVCIGRERRVSDQILSGETTMLAVTCPSSGYASGGHCGAAAGETLYLAFSSGRVFAQAVIDCVYEGASYDKSAFEKLAKSHKARLNLLPQFYAHLLQDRRVSLVGFKAARPVDCPARCARMDSGVMVSAQNAQAIIKQ
jgi:hypothetical protein